MFYSLSYDMPPLVTTHINEKTRLSELITRLNEKIVNKKTTKSKVNNLTPKLEVALR